MPMRLYEKIAGLLDAMARGNATGDGAGAGPTEAEIAVNKIYQQQIEDCQREFKQLMDKEVPAFNEKLRQTHRATAVVP